MFIQFLLFLITVLLIAIFWELTKINNGLKKTLTGAKEKAPVTPSA